MKFLRFSSLWLLAPLSAALAAPPEIDPIPAAANLKQLVPAVRQSGDDGRSERVTNQQLAAQPGLARALLDQAVRDEQWPVVKAILPVYARTQHADDILIDYARASLARSEGRYPQAIARYRAILARQPQLDAVRLDLARALAENHQYDTAEYHFQRVLQSNPPPQVQATIADWLQHLRARGSWSGSFGLSYLNDSNVNNASPSRYIRIGDRLFERDKDAFPQRGEGVWFSGALQRDVALHNQHGLRLLGTVSGKSYWNNHRFDDITSRLYAGYVHKAFRHQLALLPFYEKRWYGTESYSSGPGVRGEYSYLISPSWQVSQVLEYQQLDYDNRDYAFLQGHNRYASVTLSHAFNSRLSAFGGVDIADQKTSQRSESNRRYGVRAGLEADLPWQLSVGLTGAVAQRRYLAENDIFSLRRSDDELMGSLSLWHRDLSFYGVQPRLNVVYKRVNSNIDFYDYRQRSVFISMNKLF